MQNTNDIRMIIILFHKIIRINLISNVALKANFLSVPSFAAYLGQHLA
jgi:hypothetical protein